MILQQGTFVSNSGNILHRSTPEAELFFIRNLQDEAIETDFEFPVTQRIPELWDAYTGTIKSTNSWKQEGDTTRVTLKLEKDESVFVIFPAQKTAYEKLPEKIVLKENAVKVEGKWKVTFYPKTDEKPFKREFVKLTDFSVSNDEAVKYFSGMAVYEKKINIKAQELTVNKRILLDLGELYDIAELEINGEKAGVLWLPPYRTDISSFLKAGENSLKVLITNTWINRLIGDEQYPEDFEWTDKNQGLRAMTGLPEWFVEGKPRPVKERRTFTPWYYFDKNSPLVSAGLLGPVQLVKGDVK
jgi:hypothetical protein